MSTYGDNMKTPDKKKIFSTYIKSEDEVNYSSLKASMKLDSMPGNTSMVVFSVLVELMSMMRMHTLNTTVSKPVLSLYFGEDLSMYYLRCENTIKTEHAHTLIKYIERFNKHDKVELRRYFKYVRKASSVDGVGLELVEIAKRATAPIGFSITEQTNGTSVFAMLIRIKKEVKVI